MSPEDQEKIRAMIEEQRQIGALLFSWTEEKVLLTGVATLEDYVDLFLYGTLAEKGPGFCRLN